MHYFTEDAKVKELKAIFEAMETSSVVDEPEVITDPLQDRQDTVDAERKRRELANAAIKKGEKSVTKTDFGSQKADLEAQVAKKDFAINFLTKQMEVTQDPEDKQGFSDLIQDKVNEKNALLTQLMHVSDQAGTQASISSGNDEEVVTEAAPLDLSGFDSNNLHYEDDATLDQIIHQVYGDQVDVTGIPRDDLVSLAADALGEVSHHQAQAQADTVIDQNHGLDEADEIDEGNSGVKTLKTIKDLQLKDGTSIPQGSSLEFIRPGEMDTVGIFSYNGRELKMRYRNVLKNPSMNSLEKWTNDSECKSVFGATVEPDGHGPQGEPSWLLAMGMI